MRLALFFSLALNLFAAATSAELQTERSKQGAGEV